MAGASGMSDQDKVMLKLGELSADMSTVKKAVSGNGQPGLVQRVESLEAGRNYLLGGMAVLTAIGASVWGFLEWVFHFSKGTGK